MPRIAREGADPTAIQAIADWNTRTGNGTSTYDVCASCWSDIHLEEVWPDDLPPYNGEPEISNDLCVAIGQIDHPAYEDTDVSYHCARCKAELTEADN